MIISLANSIPPAGSPPETGAGGHVDAGIEQGEEFGDLEEVVGVVRILDDDIAPPGAGEPGEVGVAVAPFLRPDDPGPEVPGDRRRPVLRGVGDDDLAVDLEIGKDLVDLSDAFADGGFLVERGEDDGEGGGIHGILGIVSGFRRIGRIDWGAGR